MKNKYIANRKDNNELITGQLIELEVINDDNLPENKFFIIKEVNWDYSMDCDALSCYGHEVKPDSIRKEDEQNNEQRNQK